MADNSLIKIGKGKGVFGPQSYTQEDLDAFLQNYDTFTEDAQTKGYMFDMSTLSMLSSDATHENLLFNGQKVKPDLSEVIKDDVAGATTTYSSEKIEEINTTTNDRIDVTDGNVDGLNTEIINIKNSIVVGGSNTNVIQKTYLSVVANDIKYITIDNPDVKDQVIIQMYKFIPGTQNVVEVIKTFNNGESVDFYYRPNVVIFDGSVKINGSNILTKTVNVENLYESEIIDKTTFIDLFKIEVV